MIIVDEDHMRHSEAQLSHLQALQQHQLATVPFENLSLHYSPHHTISLDPDGLYQKIVYHRRGGYCMENNFFFGTVLRSLSFKVCSVGARVNEAASGTGGQGYLGWSHMVNIVTLPNGLKYTVDVGFGGNGPIQPLLLRHGHEERGIFPASIRLVQQNLPQHTDHDQWLWVYQHRNSPTEEWLPMYCFTEIEFLPIDYEMMNFWTSHSRRSWFTHRIAVVKMILVEDVVVGTLMLVGADVKKRVRGETEHLRTCKTEADRLEALREVFGITLLSDEREGIRDMVTALAA